jgi:hypothetical protein
MLRYAIANLLNHTYTDINEFAMGFKNLLQKILKNEENVQKSKRYNKIARSGSKSNNSHLL